MMLQHAVWLIHPVVYSLSTIEDTQENLTGPVTHQPIASVNAPHHFLVFYQRVYCSGSLIGSKIVLTVASCFHVGVPVIEVSVKFGCKESLEMGTILKVVEKKEHEYFRYKSELDNDIALLVLERDVTFNAYVQKILLYDPESGLPEFSSVSVTGWGGKSNRMYDNGGAAVYGDHVVGISSYGAHIPDKPYVALFTNVTYFYKWIELNSERLLTKHCFSENELDYSHVERNYAEMDP